MTPVNPSPNDYQGLSSVFDRLPGCINRGVALLIRVSSERQKANIGSLGFQDQQLRHLERYGVKKKNVAIFNALAESAGPGTDRPVFRELLASTQAGEVGLVVVADVDRAARNEVDGEALAEALSAVGGLLMVNGDIYDPADASHRMILAIRVAVARFENDQRALRSIAARLVKARELKAYVNLGTGLIWGSHNDPEFVKRMKDEGLDEHLTHQALVRHREEWEKDGLKMRVFPAPDSDAQKAYKFAFKWLFETRSLNEVMERIAMHPDWPKAGMFPVTHRSTFHADKPVVKWRQVTDRKDGKDDAGKTTLYDWFRTPSLYGIFGFKSTKITALSRKAAALGTQVWEERAFPGLASPDDYERVKEILSNPKCSTFRGMWEGPRNHFLPEVRCSHPMPNGEVCGRKMPATYATARDGAYYYVATACGQRGHRVAVPQSAEAVVLEIVKEAFSQECLRSELARIRVDSGADHQRVLEFQDAVRTAEDRLRYDDDQAFKAHQSQDVKSVEFYDRQRQEHLLKLDSLRKALRRAEAAIERTGPLVDAEYDAIVSLAGDIPNLLALSEGIEGKTYAVLQRLIRRVHVRRLGSQVYWVEVEFPSGERVGRRHIHGTIVAPQPVRVLAHHRLTDYLAPSARDTVEKEKNAVAAAQALADELNQAYEPTTPWTADRVFAAAHLFDHKTTVKGRRGRGRSIPEMADQLRVPAERVTSRATSGDLGPARMRNGVLQFRPTKKEIHVAFEAPALRDVATGQGWPVDDTVLIADLRKETGWTWQRVKTTAEVGGGILKDSAGRRYTRRSGFLIPAQEDLQGILQEALPKDADLGSGEWLTWAQAHQRFPAVNVTTFRNHTAVVKPGFGENGRRTVYIWVDPRVEERVHKPLLPEALECAGLALEQSDFILRTEALELFAKKFGFPSYSRWTDAVEDGKVLEVRARTESCARLRVWAWVPEDVRASEDPETVRRFLTGEKLPVEKAS